MSGFPGDLFAARRARVLRELGEGAMVLPAAPIQYRAGDSELRYRPDSELFYLTGIVEPEAVLVLRGFAQRERALLFVRPRDSVAELWSGPRVGPEAAPELFGIDGARSIDEMEGTLPTLLQGADRIFLRLGIHPRIEAGVVGALRHSRLKGARTGSGPRGVLDPGEILDEMRLRKDPLEIAAMREAASITVSGFCAGIGAVRPGAGEWEVEAAVEGEFRRRGALGPSFATIVGSGRNACVLHYIDNAARMRDGELVLIDAGAEWRMYSGDITRTVPVSGQFSAEQRAVYDIVETARSAAVAAVVPGARTDEIHRAAVAVITRGLREIGVLSGDLEALMDEKAHEPFFPHRTSHWLGLNTHDVGDYARGGEPRALEPGMALTVEPGLYFPPGDDRHRFGGIGIRIEDDVLVTESASEVLTAALPTEIEAVRAMVGSGVRERANARA